MDRIKINLNMNFTYFFLFTLFLHLMTAGDALEFPRKGYRFPLKRQVDEGFKDSALKERSSEDLVPMAQSYFITPETPTTTTIKPTFKRRSTNQPISATWVKSEDKKTAPPSDGDTSTMVDTNASRRIVDTGFQPKKSFSNKKRRPSSSSSTSSIDMMRRDQNVNEGGGAPIESTSTSTNYEKKEAGNNEASKKFGGRRKPKKMLDYAGISPSSATFAKIIPSPRPSRFSGHRRNSAASATNSGVKNVTDEVQGSTSESPVTSSANGTGSTTRAPFSRSGRQFGRGPRAERVEIQPQLATTENQPLRRRKKFTSTTVSSTNSNLAVVGGANVNNESALDQVGLSDAAATPSVQDPELQRINANVFANRRPFPIVNRFATASTLINPLDNAQVQQDNAPINRNRRMRNRPAPKTLLTPVTDSEHQSSSDTITILAASGESQSPSDDLGGEVGAKTGDNASDVPAPSLPGSRNLSNRKPNPLDKLNTRQAAARRFLTPKKNTEETGEPGSSPATPTTKAPPLQTTPRAPRKSPLSLANLRNRRIGGSSTTSTTEAPIVSNVDPQSHEVLGNLDALTGEVASVNGSSDSKNTSKPETGTAEGGDESPKKDEAEETPVEEEPKSPLAGLLKNRRPPLRRPLPGARSGGSPISPINIPIKPRGPLKPKPTQATTEAPQNVETTTQPTCEEGKRYNKILRKCIPGFKSG